MKLHQLRYLAAVAQSGLNITAAAQKLHTSQPGVSKQIKLLEDELGFQIFVREGRNLTRITPAGQQVIDRALHILQEAQSIRALSTELRDEGRGSLSIGTTHTQARYVLPGVIREFLSKYPNVRLNLHQGTSEQIAEMVAQDRIDCAINTGSERLFSDLTILPCYRWNRVAIVPRDHPLASAGKLTYRALAAYPIITYTFSFSGPSSLIDGFAKANLTPNVAITARDSDVIVTYVRLGLGVGIVAHMAVDDNDPDLAVIDASHLLPAHTTWLGFRRGTLLRKYTLESGEDPGRAGDHLGRLLARRPRTLLVIDDVWEPEQLEPFLRGAQERCVRLVTTRRPAVLPPDARRVVVDRMSSAQAHAVLTHQLGTGLPAPLAEGLVKATGRWALLLRLVNQLIVVQTATGVPLESAARAILGRLLALGPAGADPDQPLDLDDPARRNTAVRASIQAATELLPRGGGRRFSELGIFAEDEAIPVPLAALLWRATGGLGEAEARSLCMQMAELSLLGLDGSVEGGTVALHDVVRDYLRVEIATDVAALNSTLVDAAAAALPPAGRGGTQAAWWEADDGYLQDHLIEHLLDAGRAEEAERVAGDLRWVQARLHQRGPTAPWRDLDTIPGPAARALAADIARAAHLLSPTEPPHALDAVLRSRLTALSQWNDPPQPSVHHVLTNRWPPPDLPDPSLLRTLTGSTAAVQALAFAPDGSLLATAGDDQCVRLWNPATGACLRSLTGHEGRIRAVSFSVDGTMLATAGEDRCTRVWNPATGVCLRTVRGRIPHPVAFSPDGSLLTDAADDGCLWGRDAVAGTALRRLTGQAGEIRSMAFSPDGTMLATAADDGWVRIWNTATGSLVHSVTDHVSGSRAVAFSPDGTLLATGGEDRRVHLWDPVNGTALRTLSGHEGYVNAVAFSPDGTLLATAGYDRSVRMWNPRTGEALRALSGHEGYVNAVAFSPDGTLLAAAGHDRAVRLRNPAARTPGGEGIGVREVAVAAGSRLVTADEDGRVRLRDAADGTVLNVLTDYARGVRTVAFSADGTSLATVGEDGQMWVWDPDTGIPAAAFGADSIRNIRAAAYSPSGRFLATADGYRTLHLRDPATGAVRHTFTTDHRGTRALAFSADGTLLAAVGNDATVTVWDIDAGDALHTLTHDSPGTVQAAAFRADGEMLATSDEHGTVFLWNLVTGTVRDVLTGHEGPVGGLAFSGPWLATVGEDATLRIWDPDCRTALTLMRTDSPLRCCSWSPDGRTLFAGGRRGLFGYDYRPSANGP